MGEFVLFERGTASASPRVTIQTGGALNMNKATTEKLGNPKHVQLLFDADDQRIMIRRAEMGETGALKVNKTANASSNRINSKAFMDEHGIDYSGSNRYPVDFGKEPGKDGREYALVYLEGRPQAQASTAEVETA